MTGCGYTVSASTVSNAQSRYPVIDKPRQTHPQASSQALAQCPLESCQRCPKPALEKRVILIRRAQRPQGQGSRAARYSIISGQAADAANEPAPPLGNVTRLSRIDLAVLYAKLWLSIFGHRCQRYKTLKSRCSSIGSFLVSLYSGVNRAENLAVKRQINPHALTVPSAAHFSDPAPQNSAHHHPGRHDHARHPHSAAAPSDPHTAAPSRQARASASHCNQIPPPSSAPNHVQ